MIRIILLISLMSLGIFPLLGFAYSLFKPTKFSKKVLLTLPFLMLPLMLFWLKILFPYPFPRIIFPAYIQVFIFLPLFSLLIALSGISSLADLYTFKQRTFLSILITIGCMGLTFDAYWLFFYPVILEGHNAENILVFSFISGGIETAGALIFMKTIWDKNWLKKRKIFDFVLKLKHKRKIKSSGFYKKNSIIKSFFRFLKNQPETKKLAMTPLCFVIYVLLVLMIFVAPSNNFIENLFTTFIGILITVSFISFIQYRENQKKSFPVIRKILENTISNCHKFIRFLFEDFFAPLTAEEEREYISANIEPYALIDSYRRYLRNSDLLIKLAKDVANKKLGEIGGINSAKHFLDAKKDLIDNLNMIKRDNFSILDLMIINEIEKFNERNYYSYAIEKPGEDRRHTGQWAGCLFKDIQSTLINCFNLLEAIKSWDQDQEKVIFD